jgi:hypothetical protein
VAALGIALACACSRTDNASKASLAEGCVINSDCNAPLVCAFKQCHDICASSRDCPNSELCVASDKPFHVCQLPNEVACTTNAECPGTQICGVDERCRDACLVDRDCLPNQNCVIGTCADVGSPPIAAATPEGGATDATAPTGQPCQYNHDCTAPLVCVQGRCELECLVDIDCPHGDKCVGNQCLPPTSSSPTLDGSVPEASIPEGAPAGYAGPCRANDDCPNMLLCKGGQCLYQCLNNFDCDTKAGECCAPWHACVTGLTCFAGDAGVPVAVCNGHACPVFADNQSKPTAIVSDGKAVYWADSVVATGAVRGCPIAGCTPAPTDLATNQGYPNWVTVAGANVYFTDFASGLVQGVPLLGADSGAPISFAPQSNPTSVASDGTTVWIGHSGGIQQCSPGSCLRFGFTGDQNSMSVTLDVANVYWVAGNGTGIRVTTAAGGGTGTLLWSEPNIVALAVDDANVYFVTSGSAGRAASFPKAGLPDGGTPKTLGMARLPHAIAVDPNFVYWTDADAGTVSRVAIAGGAPLAIAAGLSQPWGVTVDRTAVYWTNAGDGTVMKISK